MPKSFDDFWDESQSPEPAGFDEFWKKSTDEPEGFEKFYASATEEDPGFFERMGASAESVYGGFQKTAGLTAGALGFDEIEQSLLESGEASQADSASMAYQSKYGDEGFEQFKNLMDPGWWKSTIAELAPGSVPFLAGAGTGAVVGSAVPIIGTMVGAILGGGTAILAQSFGDNYYEFLERNPEDKEGAGEYAVVKSGLEAVINAASIPLAAASAGAGFAATQAIKNGIMNTLLKIGGTEVVTENIDTIVGNAVDQAYLDPDIPLSRGLAQSTVGGILFDAPAISAGVRRAAQRTPVEPELTPIVDTPEDIAASLDEVSTAVMDTESVDEALATAESLIEEELVRNKVQTEINAEIELRQQERVIADTDVREEEITAAYTQRTEEQSAIDKARGADEVQPTAMAAAFQKAEQAREQKFDPETAVEEVTDIEAVTPEVAPEVTPEVLPEAVTPEADILPDDKLDEIYDYAAIEAIPPSQRTPQKMAERKKRMDWSENLPSLATPGAVFKNASGSLMYSIHEATSGDKKYQVTVWDEDGAMSDSKHDTAEGIVTHYRGEFKSLSSAEELDSLVKLKPKAVPFVIPEVTEQERVIDLDRIQDESYRVQIQQMSSNLVEGGGISLIPSDELGVQFKGRTKSQNEMWFQGMNEESETSMSVKAVQNMVKKALAGEKLGVRQQKVLNYMLDSVDDVAIEQQEIEMAARRLYEYDPAEFRNLASGMSEIQYEAYDAATKAAQFEETEFADLADEDYDRIKAEGVELYDNYTRGVVTEGEREPEAITRKDEGAPEGFELDIETEQDRITRETGERQAIAKEAADKKVVQDRLKAEEEAGDFTLSGSDADVDVAISKGQKPLFSLEETPQNDLFVTHNLTAANIRHAEKMGGLAAPSLAVARTSVGGMETFGEISLIADPDITIRNKAKTFDADVYSPRYPTIKYKVDRKGYDSAWNKLNDTSKELGYVLSSQLDESTIEDRGMEAFIRSSAVQYEYLKSIGKAPDIIYRTNQAGNQEVDRYAVESVVRPLIEENETAFNSWVDENFSSVISKEQIFKGYTPSGNRRYAAHTLDNVVKDMVKNLRSGEGFSYGVGNIRAQAAKQFKTVKGLQKDRDRIVSSEEMKTLKEEVNDELFSIAEELKPNYKYDSEAFGYMDQIVESMEDFAKMGPRGLTQDFENLSEEQVSLVGDYINKLRNMPTEYFETKVQRAVGLGEFTAAIVPSNTPQDVIDILESNGLDIRRYDETKKEGRVEEISKLDELLFSKSLYTDKQTSYTKDKLNTVVANELKNIKADINIKVIDSSEIDAETQKDIPEGRRPKGWMVGNTVYLVSDHIKNDYDALVTFAHEVKGHVGVDNIIENWDATVTDYGTMKTQGGNTFKSIHDELTKRYGMLDEATEVKEFIAIAAERRVTDGPVGRFMAKVRNALVKGLRLIGFTKGFGMTDIDTILSRSEQFLKGDTNIGDVSVQDDVSVPAFSIDEEAERQGAEDKGLPMDKESRMARAEEMGFDTDQVWYHGTSADITAFDPNATGEFSSLDTEGVISLTPWDDIANNYAKASGKTDIYITSPVEGVTSEEYEGLKSIANTAFEEYKKADKSGEDARQLYRDYQSANRDVLLKEKSISSSTGANVIPVYVRGAIKKIDAEGLSHDARWMIKEQNKAKEEGYGGVQFIDLSDDTYYNPLGMSADTLQIFNPNQIRSINAAFDPEFKDSGQLLFSLEDQGYTSEEQKVIDKGGFGRKTTKEKFKTRFDNMRKNAKTKFRQKLVDQFASFREIMKDERTWMLSQLTSSASGGIEAMIDYGHLGLDKSGVVTVDTSKKGLGETLQPLGDNLDKWTYWMAGNRANGLMKQGKENLFTQKDIDVLMGMNKGNEELFDSVRKEFESLHNSLVRVAVQTGLVNAEEARQWKEEGFYLPFYRILEEGDARGPRAIGNSGLVRQQAYKELKGGVSQLDDLMVNSLLNWNHLLGASLKNQSARSALKTAVTMGIARQVSKAAKSKDAVYVREDGKEVWYEVDEPLVLDSLIALNWEGLNGRIMDTARMFKRALTYGVTASPEFKARNLIRDSVQAIAVADMSTQIYKNLYQGWKGTQKDSDVKAQMLAGGGSFGQSGYIHGSDPEAIKRLVERGLEQKSVKASIIDTPKKFKKIWDAYQDFGARLENINRAANYSQAIAEGKDRLTANFEARDHLDFTRTGSATAIRAIAQTVPFLNARLQGLDKLGRAAMDPKQRAQFTAVVGVYTAMSVALYLAMKDDEDYAEAEEWEKRTYHLFKLPGDDTMYRIPRPFEVGAIAFLGESMAQQMVDDDVHGQLFAERLGHTLADTFSFNPLPQVFKPALEIAMNKSLFTGRKIESMSMSNLSPAKRKRAWTSETAIAMSEGMDKITWGKVVLSPVQIQHLVRGYLGWLGATSMQATDMLVTRPLTDAPSLPATRVTEYPLIKAFARSGPNRNTVYTTQFYERLNEINRAYADIQQAKKLNDADEYRKLLAETKDDLKLRKFYNRQAKNLSKINKRLSQVRRSNMSPVDKLAEIDRLTLAKNRITRMVAKR